MTTGCDFRAALSRRAVLLGGIAGLALSLGPIAFAQTQAQNQAQPPVQTAPAPQSKAPMVKAPTATVVNEVVVTSSRVNLIGVAATASQGSVTQKELELRPVYRVGQMLETTPGLIVTVHSGEGKANQYLLRGFNLDHGTDIANFVDDMPINRPTNTHGQGYSDVNFEVPQMASGLDFTKGPYYAAVGDFGAVASTHLKLANTLPNQISATVGTLGRYTFFGGGTQTFSDDDRLAGGVTYDHVDGPFDHPDNFRKWAGELRYSHGSQNDGYSVTAMYYKGDGNFTTDQPVAAVTSGLIGRFGTLDPTDGNSSERASLSAHYAKSGDGWKFDVSGYVIHSRMVLWNDFTHYLDDQTNGDQEEQDETRDTFGGQAALTLTHAFGPVDTSTVFGLQARRDQEFVGRRHTRARQVLNYCSVEIADPALAPAGARLNIDGSAYFTPASNGNCQADRVNLLDLGPYVENTTRWTPWLRTIVGLRDEYYAADDRYFGVTAINLIQGQKLSGNQSLLQPKGSVVLGPFFKTELYLSAGRGFHSDDVRGVFGTVPIEGLPGAAGRTPLLAPADGFELGLRTNLIPKVAVQVALFQEDFNSELRYDADQGQDAASGPSRRQGIELSAQYKPISWLEFNTDLAFSKARYRGDAAALDSYGIEGGAYIANAPSFIGSFGIIADHGPWFGGLQWRDLGAYPLTDGPQFPQDHGFSEFNANLGYRIDKNLTVEASGFNLLNTQDHSAAYDYTYRLTPTSPAQNGPTFHPLEPISGQVKVTWLF
jgi:hypothetical protein